MPAATRYRRPEPGGAASYFAAWVAKKYDAFREELRECLDRDVRDYGGEKSRQAAF